MPRARTTTSENTQTVETPPAVKRAPRKRVAKPVFEGGSAVAPVERMSVDEGTVTAARATARRKAPRIVSEPSAPVSSGGGVGKQKKHYIPYVVGAVLFVISIGVSAMVGLSDSGSIDVGARINEQSALQAGNGGLNSDGSPPTFIPVQNSQPPSVPNGGLVGVSPVDQAAFVPPPVLEAAPATSSGEVAEAATSTDETSAPAAAATSTSTEAQ